MGRSPCCDKQGLKKGPWTQEEDKILVDFIQAHGHGSWRSLPKLAGLVRCGKSCRLRWTNYLRPDIKRGPFTPDEQKSIIQLHGIVGNKWSAIAAQLPGRTDNEIKNHWNTHLKKRLLRMGLNPDTSASATRHMAQWESARLEAEARLSRESLLSRDSLLFSPATSSSQDNINNTDDILAQKLEPDIFLRIWNSEVGDAFRKQSTSSCSVKLEESDVTMSAANVGSRDDVDSKSHVAAGESSSTNEDEETYQQYLREFAGDEFSLFHGQLGGFSLFQGELNVDGLRDHD